MSYPAYHGVQDWGEMMVKIKSFVVLLIILALAFAQAVGFARRAEKVDDERIAWLTGNLIAHRGMFSEEENIPENTIPAFARAIEHGHIIELDVAMTKDKEIVVFHDKKLKRLFGIDSYLADMNYEELQELKFASSEEKIPLFSEVLAFVNGQVPLLIEIKNEGEVGEMESLVYDQLREYKGEYAVQSFNPFTLAWFRKNAPEVLRGQLSGSFIVSDYEVEYAGTTRLPWHKRFLLSNLLLNFASRPNFIAYEINNTDIKALKNVKKLGVPLLGWTVRDRAEYERVKDICDNFITEIYDL